MAPRACHHRSYAYTEKVFVYSDQITLIFAVLYSPEDGAKIGSGHHRSEHVYSEDTDDE